MQLPKRATPYIMTLLLVVLIALVFYLNEALSSPALHEAVKRAKERQATPVKAGS